MKITRRKDNEMKGNQGKIIEHKTKYCKVDTK